MCKCRVSCLSFRRPRPSTSGPVDCIRGLGSSPTKLADSILSRRYGLHGRALNSQVVRELVRNAYLDKLSCGCRSVRFDDSHEKRQFTSFVQAGADCINYYCTRRARHIWC